jgi:hypothetical protein
MADPGRPVPRLFTSLDAMNWHNDDSAATHRFIVRSSMCNRAYTFRPARSLHLIQLRCRLVRVFIDYIFA